MSALVLLALWLGWQSWALNIKVACWRGEWPQLATCEQINGHTPQEKVTRLQDRLAANPGGRTSAGGARGVRPPAGLAAHLNPITLLAEAAPAAPLQVGVLRLHATTARPALRWVAALDPLVRQQRSEGAWFEARALGLPLWDRPLPLIFNGDFEQAMVASGFD